MRNLSWTVLRLNCYGFAVKVDPSPNAQKKSTSSLVSRSSLMAEASAAAAEQAATIKAKAAAARAKMAAEAKKACSLFRSLLLLFHFISGQGGK